MNKPDKKIILINELESTNNYANKLILSKAADEGTVVLTQFQKMGRGQLGSQWESEAGKNLLASIILYPDFLKASKQFQLSKIVSLSIVDFLKNEINDVFIKWPNDIYVGDKKIAGILIENSIKGSNLYSSIVGIGMNLNQIEFLSDAVNPVSLKQITGKDYNVEDVASELFSKILVNYKKLKSMNFSEVDSAYIYELFGKEEWRLYRKEGISFEAKIVGVSDFGQLQLEDKTGKIQEFMFKEVEFVF